MIHYTFYQKNPASHYVYIDLEVSEPGELLRLSLPVWRPGRYERGNFARNIKKVEAFDENDKPLRVNGDQPSTWSIESKGTKSVRVNYSYYAAELNAGSCFADTTQMYINPVHCCMLVNGRQDQPHQVTLKIPAGYSVACQLKKTGNTILKAQSFDELADSPWIASAGLQSFGYEAAGVKFHLHFNGHCRPDVDKITAHFRAFSEENIAFWKYFPSGEYHFLFQVLASKFYHGVEHLRSTVIALGPGHALNHGSTYEDLLGVSCHELFHVWNVKTLRPAAMMPYDFFSENVSSLGYVYEGFTTYYGDKLLLTSGVFSLDEYLATLAERLQKHFHNFGRFNLSVAQSSRETWLDGYVPGAPYRKTSIYDEGCLVAFILDVSILRATSNRRSLRDVCLLLNDRFGKNGRGYADADVIAAVNEVAGADLTHQFEKYVYAPADLGEPLAECFSYLGITFTRERSPHACESHLGFKIQEGQPFAKVALVAPYSPAWKAGLFAGDEILAVNGVVTRQSAAQWITHFMPEGEVVLTVASGEQLKTLSVSAGKSDNIFFNPVLKCHLKPGATNEALSAWRKPARQADV